MKFIFRFKFKGSLFWRKRTVIGYSPVAAADRMILFFEDGGIEEIAGWSGYHAKMGPDWVLAMKTKMEKEAGTAVR